MIDRYRVTNDFDFARLDSLGVEYYFTKNHLHRQDPEYIIIITNLHQIPEVKQMLMIFLMTKYRPEHWYAG